MAPALAPSPALADLPRQHGFEPLRVEGRLPDGLEGTLYRNGQGLSVIGGRRAAHWFDVDGALSAVRFTRGQASGAARVVETAALKHERTRGKRVWGGFGAPGPGLVGMWALAARGLPRIKNPANTSVLLWQGRLFALCEAGLPVEVDPAELATVGETDLGGAIVQTFSAHPHAVPARNAFYNFGIRYGRAPVLDVYELPFSGPPRRLTSVKLASATMIHDFVATERHLVFFAPPFAARAWPLISGTGSFADALEWKPALGTEVIVVPLDSPAAVERFTVEPFFQWHFANAYEKRGTNDVVVDLVRYPDAATLGWLQAFWHGRPAPDPGGRLVRAVVARGERQVRFEPLVPVAAEFPRVAASVEGAPHRYLYAAGTDQGSLWVVDAVAATAATWRAGEGQIPSEPVFAPRPRPRAENDGWLLSLVYDGASHTSHVAILDAARVPEGPVARVWFDHHVPLTFHGAWAAA